jgi:hypothetical protein
MSAKVLRLSEIGTPRSGHLQIPSGAVLHRLGGWKTSHMVERYVHLAPEALQGEANRLDAFGGYAAATQNGQRVSPKRANPLI